MLSTDLPEIITSSLPGPKAKAIIDRRENVVPSAIRCGYPVVIARGEGAMIEDVDGNRFLDWVGGVGVLNIGYHISGAESAHPKAKALRYVPQRLFGLPRDCLDLCGHCVKLCILLNNAQCVKRRAIIRIVALCGHLKRFC